MFYILFLIVPYLLGNYLADIIVFIQIPVILFIFIQIPVILFIFIQTPVILFVSRENFYV